VTPDGSVQNEGDIGVSTNGPYSIAYGAMVPRRGQADNLLVPVCLSASHIAYGSIRMEPVFMVLGQSAAVAASLAIDKKTSLLRLDISQLQHILTANPLADGSSGDIFIDNENKGAVVATGNWKLVNDARNSYGPSWLQAEAGETEIKSATFTPDIRKAGRYQVYTYTPRITGAAPAVVCHVFNGQTNKEVMLDHKNLVVQGQTSGEWVSLGTYHFPAGKKAFVSITNKNAAGIVIADAVLLVPEKR